jgi:HAD superfamily hydrolase (TIGR01662 family)
LLQLDHDLRAGIQRFLELIHPVENVNYDAARRIGDAMGRASEAVRLNANYEVSFEAFHRNWCDRFGVTCGLSWREMDLEYFKASHHFRPEEGVVEMLEHLRASGVKMGVVSNSFHCGASLEWQVRESGMLDFFEFVISSADYGFRKPHPELFETAIARLGVVREKVWFIGDKPEADIVGAKSVGLTAVWYNADNEPPCTPEPDLTVKSWDEFRQLIGRTAD